MNEKYPAWIDEYACSIHQAFSGMVPAKWSSLDGYKVFAAFQGASIFRLRDLALALSAHGKTPAEQFKLFSTPSTIRNATLFLAWEYKDVRDKTPEMRAAARTVFDWLDSILSAGMREDKWVMDKNIVHTPEEIAALLRDTPWITNNTQAVRDAGKLYVSTAAMSFALYRDFFPQVAHEVFGPYDASSSYGEGAELLIKYFPKIRPVELWPEVADFPHESVTVYQIIRGVKFRCEFIGMHSLYDGPIVPNTLASAVKADDRFVRAEEIKPLASLIAERATAYSSLYEKLDVLETKRKFVEWEMYQFIKLFDAAGMDWRPTDAMLAPILAADIPMGIQLDSFPSLEDFKTSNDHEVYWLKDLYR